MTNSFNDLDKRYNAGLVTERQYMLRKKRLEIERQNTLRKKRLDEPIIRNYWLIMQDNYDETPEQDEYGVLGERVNEWLKTALSREIEEGDIVVLMGREENKPSFYRGYAMVDKTFQYENDIGEKLIAIKFSDYTELNNKPRGKEFDDAKKIKGYHDIHEIKKINNLIFNEIVLA